MPQTAMLTWLLVGASLLGVALRVTIPPTAWLGLIAFLHASRAMRPTPGLLLVWLTLWVTFVVVRREFVPIPGVAFFVIMGLEAVGPLLAHGLFSPVMLSSPTPQPECQGFPAPAWTRARQTPGRARGIPRRRNPTGLPRGSFGSRLLVKQPSFSYPSG